jgi:hemerythrin-like domain-containing protein
MRSIVGTRGRATFALDQGAARRAAYSDPAEQENAMPVAPKGNLWPEPGAARRDGFVALDACHRRMLAVSDALQQLAEQVDRDDAGADQRATAAAIADFYATTVRQHHEDEERHVFPPLLGSADAEVVQAVLRLQQDHGWLEEDWLELEPHLQALATGYGCCDMDTLRSGAEVFTALLRDHIALEEALIYPEARAQLGEAGRRAMGREMAARRREQRRESAASSGAASRAA